ncbi:hypothetical protein [Actinokineospora globicatena]|uniref:hypothetical protein n=1 Tax=Actinokineospora globicatena TaxID=103729 RepID=UPI0020A33C50|nr:hypothetical protein [Actinokineospora globicatena]MCP2301888.1 hypothetical protein [Actinokineospora globicatena]GLW76453.1 hypothetical protein Aglo01_09350 [Actinokineospora globicatena]GLW83288.1 hypothetical protein Aglo02_09280 [Actinokineospora globicatena]
MLNDDDPAVRAIRAPFQQLSAALADELARSRVTYEQDMAKPEDRPRRRRAHAPDPSDTGTFTVSWMTTR